MREYLARMQAGGQGVASLFHDDAVLSGLGILVLGLEAIRAFYEQVGRENRPQPRLTGPLLLAGERVAAELRIELADGNTLHVLDLFQVEDGRIRSLTYFVAQHEETPAATPRAQRAC